MSKEGNVFSKGGGGTSFEQYVQASFLTTLIIQGKVPCFPSSNITEVAFQTTNRGYETDDLLVITKSGETEYKLIAQIKHNLSFTVKNDTFKEVIKAFWIDFNNDKIFDKSNDRLVIIKSGLTQGERNHLKSVLNWAKSHATEADFLSEISRIKAKKEIFDTFKTALIEANDSNSLNDKEVWSFLKCVEVLEYDFINGSSVDEANFLNLIKLSKNDNTTTDENEIWGSILKHTAQLNKDGGSETFKTIQDKEVYNFFDVKKLSPHYKSVEKLKSDSESILLPLENTINNFHIKREDLRETTFQAINENRITIITGEPGVGKSALAKDVILNEFPNASVFVFRADQFIQSTLSNVFSELGINEPLQEIFSCISLIPEKIIHIESFEKLLEGDFENAFKQFLALLNDLPNVKIVFTSRRYAVDLLLMKYGIEKEKLSLIDVKPLTDTEFDSVIKKFPNLKGLIKNQSIKKLLRVPIYLKFTTQTISQTGEDLSSASLIEFKNSLWNFHVKKATVREKGMPAKREKAFMDIAVRRAKIMRLFVAPSREIDEEAVVYLENDNIIFRENDNEKYSPSHDVFEDWALVRYVDSIYDDYHNPIDLFKQLGNEPAIRRGFRLWVEEQLIKGEAKFIEFIIATINNTNIERYWTDELLVAVFKSEDCSFFFTTLKEKLLENKAKFLNRCILLIKTTCKENKFLGKDNKILLPIGSGWKEVIAFTNVNLMELKNIESTIINFLEDWQYRLILEKNKVAEGEAKNVKEIVLQFIKSIEEPDNRNSNSLPRKKIETSITILFNLTDISGEEIRELFKRVFIRYQDYRFSYYEKSFYGELIKKSLSGSSVYNNILIKELPDLVIEIAWKAWKLRISESDNDSISSKIRGNRLPKKECWGILDDYEFMPSGVYKTPIYNLLNHHPTEGVKFVVQFINYSVDFYAKNDCEYKHNIGYIEFELNENSKKKVWANFELWVAYRGGMSVTHYLLESILISLERFLIELAKTNTENSVGLLKLYFSYLITNTNNVAILGVLSSVIMAYPKLFGKEILPLFSIKEIYYWDLSRALRETSHSVWRDTKIPFADEENVKFNALPHRKKFLRGWGDFVVDYQFNIGTLNKEIYAIFDKLNTSKEVSENIEWKKKLTEIDIRNWKVSEFDEERKGFIYQPEYSDDVGEFLQEFKASFIPTENSLSHSSIISKAFEGKQDISFEQWKGSWIYYTGDEPTDFMYDRKVSLAVIGVREFWKVLSKKQKKWCISTIQNSIKAVLNDIFSHSHDIPKSYNLTEKSIILESFHLILDKVGNADKDELKVLMLYMLIAPMNDHEFGKVIHYMRTVFFNTNPKETKEIWKALINFSHFKKANYSNQTSHSQSGRKNYIQKEQEFINNSFSSQLEINFLEINFNKFEASILARAFVITPYEFDEYKNFIFTFIPLLFSDLQYEEFSSTFDRVYERQIESRLLLDSELYLSDLLLNSDKEFAKEVLVKMLDSLGTVNEKNIAEKSNVVDFIERTLKYVVLKLFDNRNISDNELYNQQKSNFWYLWYILYQKIKEFHQYFFFSMLFCDIKPLTDVKKHTTDEKSWQLFKENKEFYNLIYKEFYKNGIVKHLINVFSSIGADSFLPDGIKFIVKALKENSRELDTLSTSSSERLIKIIFLKNTPQVLQDSELLSDYIWLLDNMVSLGSSNAYLYREQVITYKKLTA